MPVEIVLPEKVRTHFEVTETLAAYDCGQKYTFKVRCKHGICMLKMLKMSLDERAERELALYEKYSEFKGIPKIISVERIGSDWVVSEVCIEGRNLDEAREDFEGNPRAIAELLVKMIDVLDPLWVEDVIHRDLKPANIMIDSAGGVHVIDFGIHKSVENETITRTDFQPCSLYFGAPEQLIPSKKDISYRTDFFSMGVVAFDLMFGHHPFGSTIEEITQAYRDGYAPKFENVCLSDFFAKTMQCLVSRRARNSEILRVSLQQCL